MIDYALKPPVTSEEINIEKINSSSDYLKSMNNEEQSLYAKSYKYPYLACEILSHDYPFLVDKIINMDFYGQENNTIGGELSMIKNTSNVDEGDEGGADDSMGEFRNQQENQEEDIIDTNNNNTFFNTTIDNNLNNEKDTLEFVDYLYNSSFNNDLNNIQGGYLVKINRAFLHSLYSPNKSSVYISYICFKKPIDIISNFWNKIQFFHYQEIIYDILMYCEDETNQNQNKQLDIIKTNILTKLINAMKSQSEGIKDIFCDYILNCKGAESLVNENFLSKLTSAFISSNNEKILENFCIVTGQVLKLYKNDNFSGSKNLKGGFINNFLNSSLGILNFGDSDLLVGKIISIIKEMNLENFKSTQAKIILINFIYDFMTLTRCNEFLENLININFFKFFQNLFFSSKNDIIQSIYISTIQLLIEDTNEKWITEILIKNNFLQQALSINYNPLDLNNTSFGIKENTLYIHLSEIFGILVKNVFINEILQKNNLFEKINNIYNTTYKIYVERMEQTICNFKCNSLYLPAEDSIKVDEIAEKGDIKTINDFNRFNNNIFKRNSFSSNVKKELFFDGQPEGVIEKKEDNFYDDNENKNIIQDFPNFEEDNQKDDLQKEDISNEENKK
jgi:hypothetical protein